MTISTQTARVQYAGNGVTASFPVTFEFLTASPPKVVYTDALGVDVTWVLTTNYTVTGGGVNQPATGAIVPVIIPAVGTKLTILRAEPLTQAADYVPDDPFPAVAHEKALDRLEMQIQMIAERTDRAVSIKETSSETALVFPSPEANKIIGWNSAGDGLVNKDGTSVGVGGVTGVAIFESDTVQDVQDILDLEPGVDVQEHSANLDALALSAADGRNYLDAATYVADRTALKALDTTKDTVAVLKEAGREGVFIWTSGNFATLITADTQEGIYVKADAIASSSGAWVRQNDGKPFATWFGLAEANSAATNGTALTAALNFARAFTGALHISKGEYDLNAVSITMTGNQDSLHITGDGYGKTNLRWNNTDGIAITYVASPWWFVGDGGLAGNAVTIEKLSFVQEATTGAAGIALKVNGQNLGGRPAPFFLVKECVFRSDKSATCWTKGIELTSVSTATIDTCFWYGANSDHTLGIFIELIASVGKDASPYHVRGCEAYFFGTAIKAGEFVEGLHVTDCDLVGGIFGIVWSAGSGAESQLCLHATHINVTTRALLLTGIQDSQITGNLLWCSGTNQVVCEFRDSSNMTVTGNVMQVPGASSACIVFGSTNWVAATWLTQASTVDSNKFANSGIGVSLNTTVRNVTVGSSNVYDNIVLEVNDVDAKNIVHNNQRISFTPVIVGATSAGTGTYTTQSGWYKRCGDHIEFSIRLVWTAHNGTGGIRVNGLPFSSANTQEAHAFAFYCADLTFTGVPQALMGGASAQVIIRAAISNTIATDINIDASGTMVISGSYATDAGA